MTYIYIFLAFIILFILLFIFYYDYINKNKNKKLKENFDLQKWQERLKKNLFNGVATLLTVPPEEVKTEDCSSKCDQKDCIIMENMKKNLTECIECHKNPKKCFRKSVIGGNCDDCLPEEKQIDCSNTREFGCVPPHNIYSYNGTLPYFIEVDDKNLNSPYDKKCVFCWQIHEYV